MIDKLVEVSVSPHLPVAPISKTVLSAPCTESLQQNQYHNPLSILCDPICIFSKYLSTMPLLIWGAFDSTFCLTPCPHSKIFSPSSNLFLHLCHQPRPRNTTALSRNHRIDAVPTSPAPHLRCIPVVSKIWKENGCTYHTHLRESREVFYLFLLNLCR